MLGLSLLDCARMDTKNSLLLKCSEEAIKDGHRHRPIGSNPTIPDRRLTQASRELASSHQVGREVLDHKITFNKEQSKISAIESIMNPGAIHQENHELRRTRKSFYIIRKLAAIKVKDPMIVKTS